MKGQRTCSSILGRPQNSRTWLAMMSARGLQWAIGDSRRWGEAVGTDGGIMVVVFSPVGTRRGERRE
eukprot:scaffold123053_cov17-Cyclotella_meneghiniana.AAC.1